MNVYPSYQLPTAFEADIVSCFLETFDSVWGPVADDDGSFRLQKLNKNTTVAFGKRCRLPLKKILLPANEPVWENRDGAYLRVPAGPSVAVLGLPLCELQGAWYLDQVFADEAEYQRRRSKIVLVGCACEPLESCQCREEMSFHGDYFISGERLWLLNEETKALPWLQRFVIGAPQNKPLPWPEPHSKTTPVLSIKQFTDNIDSVVWEDESRRCLSCGACSAICPTCYCFDLLDELSLKGDTNRQRAWDNCFFPEHGQVAGGHDFRAGRAERLKFRYEHKKLGFGSLRGIDSCTGCGRCREACPVDINLDHISEAFMAEENNES